MTSRRLSTGLAAIVSIALLAGGSAHAENADGGHDMGGMKMADHASTPAMIGYMKAMQVMDEAMASMKESGDADIDFVRGMIPHHQAAIDMAKVLLDHGNDPEMRKLGEAIIAAQEKEIAEMQSWLAAHAPK